MTMNMNHSQRQRFYEAINRLAEHERRMHTDAEYRAAWKLRTDAEHQALVDAARAEEEANRRAIEADKEYFTSAEFREEVVAAIIKTGATRMQAEGRTRDQARLFKEAGALGLM